MFKNDPVVVSCILGSVWGRRIGELKVVGAQEGEAVVGGEDAGGQDFESRSTGIGD